MTQKLLTPAKTKFVFWCQGYVPPEKAHLLALKLIAFIGMTPARKHPVDDYPYRGRGGKGYTLFQPLMESYLIMDVYYDHNLTEILISTCKPDRLIPEAVKSFLGKEIGPAVEGLL